MTLAECISDARYLTRTTTTGQSNAQCMRWVNEAQMQFALDVNRELLKEDYLEITPKFDIDTHFAIRITIDGSTNNDITATDVAICATAANDQTGAQVATALQTALRTAIDGDIAADITVSFDDSGAEWKFTIDAIDAASIVLADPDDEEAYYSALNILGLTAGTTSDSEVTGNKPEDCTVEVDLPSDFVRLRTDPEWNKNRLVVKPWSHFVSPEVSGTPAYYGIDGKRLRLSPTPEKQGLLHIFYVYLPTEFTDYDTDSGDDLGFDREWCSAIVYWVAFLMAGGNFEDPIANKWYALYQKKVADHQVLYANQQPKMKKHNGVKVVNWEMHPDEVG